MIFHFFQSNQRMFSRFITLCLHTKVHSYQLQDPLLNSFFHCCLHLVPRLLKQLTLSQTKLWNGFFWVISKSGNKILKIPLFFIMTWRFGLVFALHIPFCKYKIKNSPHRNTYTVSIFFSTQLLKVMVGFGCDKIWRGSDNFRIRNL